MPSTTLRRPLPALVFLVALTLLTALVWWRVLSRDGSSGANPSKTPEPTSSAAAHALPNPNTVTVRVLNATRRPGIAGKACQALASDQFITAGVSDDTVHIGKIRGVAQIRYGTGQLQAAKLLQYYFPGAALAHKTPSDPVPVVVALGKAYHAVASPTVVRAALKADDLTIARSTVTQAPQAVCNRTT
jgi:hypothetical protein